MQRKRNAVRQQQGQHQGTVQRTCNKNQEEIPQFLIADKKRGRSNKKWSEVGQSVEKIM